MFPFSLFGVPASVSPTLAKFYPPPPGKYLPLGASHRCYWKDGACTSVRIHYVVHQLQESKKTGKKIWSMTR